MILVMVASLYGKAREKNKKEEGGESPSGKVRREGIKMRNKGGMGLISLASRGGEMA